MHGWLRLPRRWLGRLRRRIDLERTLVRLRWSLDLPREWTGRLRRWLGLMRVPANALNCAVAYNKYGGYCIPASTFRHRLSRKVLAGLVWEPTTLEFMRAHCGDGDVITAGTFFGDFLPALSPALRPGATLWAFEPHPESYRCATITIMLNDLKNVRLTNAALRETYGTSNLVISGAGGEAIGGRSHIRSDIDDNLPQSQGRRVVPVNLVAIDEIVPPEARVSVVQLDIEGSEESALAGAMATIRRCRPLLILESLPRQSSDVGQELRALGYRKDRPLARNTVLIANG